MTDSLSNPEINRLQEFATLRAEAHQKMELELAERLKKNPKPTEEEILVGAFAEMIEPQVRQAVFEFYRRGYATASSGFGGEFGEIQSLDGYFDLDKPTKAKIEALGAKVFTADELDAGQTRFYTHIQFEPKNPNLDEMHTLWNKIASTLPPKTTLAEPSISGGAEEFRKQYAPNRPDIEKIVLEKRLALEEYSPEVEAAFRQRLNELS